MLWNDSFLAILVKVWKYYAQSHMWYCLVWSINTYVVNDSVITTAIFSSVSVKLPKLDSFLNWILKWISDRWKFSDYVLRVSWELNIVYVQI